MTDTIERPTVAALPKPKFAAGFQKKNTLGKPNSLLFYGFMGVHKTTIAGEIATHAKRRALYIGFERGSAPFATQDDLRAFYDADKLDILEIDPLDENALKQIQATIRDVAATDYGYDYVIVDPIDVMQDVAERHFKATNPDPKNTFWTYGQIGEWTDIYARLLHNSPHFVAIFLAHASEQKQDSGAYRLLPKLSGSSKEAVGNLPDAVIYLGVEKHPETGVEHIVAITKDSERHLSKNRYGFPKRIIDPTGHQFAELIEKAIAKPTTNTETKKAA